MSEAQRKVAAWRAVSSSTPPVRLDARVDLSVSPSAVRATFPGLTPFQMLHQSDLLERLVRLPSVKTTAHMGLVFGGAMALVLLGNKSSISLMARPTRLVAAALLAAAHACLVHTRMPSGVIVSARMNVSGSLRGPCRVVDNILSISNSHAGTHADMPSHFCHDPTVASFQEDHYTGDAVILDLRDFLREEEEVSGMAPRPITKSILKTALAAALLHDSPPLWRLLVVTRRRGAHGDDVWESDFAYFEPEAVRYMAEQYPTLLLIGTDAPSVDHPDAAPICEASHGVLYENGIAILENLQFSALYSRLERAHTLRGAMLTTFNPTQSFEDSRGCSVSFFF